MTPGPEGRPLDAALAAYLLRLGYDATPPATLETLVAVHRAHLDSVSYENLDIMLGRPTSVDPADVVARLAAGGRAGYCFHQNGALEALLLGLGFDVSRRHGHVYSVPETRFDTLLNHLVLVVRGLPTEAHPAGTWWPDVGLGEGFRDPAPLVVGRLSDPGFDFELTAVEGSAGQGGGWSFRNDPRSSFNGVEVRDLPMDVAASHLMLSTAPESPFTRMLVVQRRHAEGLDTVRGCVLTRLRADSVETTDLTTYDAWRAALVDVTRLPVHDVADDDLHALFGRTLVAHRIWEEAGRP